MVLHRRSAQRERDEVRFLVRPTEVPIFRNEKCLTYRGRGEVRRGRDRTGSLRMDRLSRSLRRIATKKPLVPKTWNDNCSWWVLHYEYLLRSPMAEQPLDWSPKTLMMGRSSTRRWGNSNISVRSSMGLEIASCRFTRLHDGCMSLATHSLRELPTVARGRMRSTRYSKACGYPRKGSVRARQEPEANWEDVKSDLVHSMHATERWRKLALRQANHAMDSSVAWDRRARPARSRVGGRASEVVSCRPEHPPR